MGDTYSKVLGKVFARMLGGLLRDNVRSTTVKVSTSNFSSLVEEFSYDARVLIDMVEIPGLLVINWDQTGIQYVHVLQLTMEREGMKQIEITGS